jgi:hypothetical protein
LPSQGFRRSPTTIDQPWVAVAVVIISLLFLIQQTEETVRSWWVIAARPGNLQGSGLFFSFRKRRGEEIERGRLPCLPL